MNQADRSRKRYRALRDRINLHKTSCVDCGKQYPPAVMEFDHRPDEVKSADISQMLYNKKPWALIEAEIAKCDPVCANCHRIRTTDRLDPNGRDRRLFGGMPNAPFGIPHEYTLSTIV